MALGLSISDLLELPCQICGGTFRRYICRTRDCHAPAEAVCPCGYKRLLLSAQIQDDRKSHREVRFLPWTQLSLTRQSQIAGLPEKLRSVSLQLVAVVNGPSPLLPRRPNESQSAH